MSNWIENNAGAISKNGFEYESGTGDDEVALILDLSSNHIMARTYVFDNGRVNFDAFVVDDRDYQIFLELNDDDADLKNSLDMIWNCLLEHNKV
ncbi:MAG: hypothetical protein ABJN65_01230 [Parasphingorhabdus sp.]